MVSDLTRFSKDEYEVLINTSTGESFCTQGMLAKICKCESTQIRRYRGDSSLLITASVADSRGVTQESVLYPEKIIKECLAKFNPDLLLECADAGVRVFMHKLAGFEITSSAVQEQKPKSLEEILLINAQALFDHKQRLDAIEQQKIPLLEKKAEALEAQVLLLENQNHLLTEQNEILEEKVAEMEFEQRTQQMEIAGNSAELGRFRNGSGYWRTVIGYANMKGIQLSLPQASRFGRQASALCRQKNIAPEPVNDPRFGRVNTYPESILDELQIA